MKSSVMLCLLGLVIIQQCMCVHIHYRGEKNIKENDEDYDMNINHEGGDHGGHKHVDCDHPIHKEEDHADHKHQFAKNVGYSPEEDRLARIRHHLRHTHE
ncbi:uncharacterized protein LOC132926829 [Rhopalosiphum padi]|uniref:uncharacterized protein LOC132926829 n=1 Tax=Rhopalosiphum padi TaxID=40932 RepID=UPI00298E7B54|nr:uncharacterized protein LOC132926829 [Rhopalosiphum padi]